MKIIPPLLVMLLVASCSTAPSIDKISADTSTRGMPKTVQDAVSVLKSQWFTVADLEWIRSNPKNYVEAELFFPFGNNVLEAFGLWGQNKELLESCGNNFAEACLDTIFFALWESVQHDAATQNHDVGTKRLK